MQHHQNEAALSMMLYANNYLVIGTGINMISNGTNCTKNGYIKIYKLLLDVNHPILQPHLICNQNINGLPKYLCEYYNGIFVAFGKRIEYYIFQNDEHNLLMNDKKFNIEIRNDNNNCYITNISFDYNNDNDLKEKKLFICDNICGFHLFKYNQNRKKINYIILQKYIHSPLSLQLLDSQTLAISNIFGNSTNNNNKTCNFNHLCEFYVGSTVKSIGKAKLSPLGRQVIIYGTITGTIGVFIPFQY